MIRFWMVTSDLVGRGFKFERLISHRIMDEGMRAVGSTVAAWSAKSQRSPVRERTGLDSDYPAKVNVL